MDHRLRPLYRTIALALIALTGGLTAGVPLLDAHEPPEGPGIEETHDASRCGYQHDHSLCVVFQQSPAEAAFSSPFRPLAAPDLAIDAPGATNFAPAPSTALHSARAPPVLL